MTLSSWSCCFSKAGNPRGQEAPTKHSWRSLLQLWSLENTSIQKIKKFQKMYIFLLHSAWTSEPWIPQDNSTYLFGTLGYTCSLVCLSAPESWKCFHWWQLQTQEWYKSKMVLKAQASSIRTSVSGPICFLKKNLLQIIQQLHYRTGTQFSFSCQTKICLTTSNLGHEC